MAGILARDISGYIWGGGRKSSGNGDKWPEAGFILNVKLIGFPEGLDIKCEDNTLFDLPAKRVEL